MIAGLVNLAFQGLELVIVAGVILSMVAQVARGGWTRHPLARALMLAARLCCAPVRQVMKGLGIPVAPLDFSPLITLVLLGVVQRVVVWFLGIFL